MLILILIDVHNLPLVFSFEKGLNGQIHSSSYFQRSIKKFPPPAKFPNPPPPPPPHLLTLFEKSCPLFYKIFNPLHPRRELF